MTDISQILRISSKTQEYEDANLSSRIVSALERAKLTTNDILTYDITEIVRRTQLSIIEVRTLVDDIAKATAPALDETADVVLANMRWLSTGEQDLDVLLGGGIPCGYITEIVGDSGAGKSNFLTQLTLHTTMHQERPCVMYISTESGMETRRLFSMFNALPSTNGLRFQDVSDRILTITIPDLETQEHILQYQIPVELSRYPVSLIVIDSVAANWRTEAASTNTGASAKDLAKRSRDINKLCQHLRSLARQHNLAIVCANQVADYFGNEVAQDVLSLDHQMRWFGGWDYIRYRDGGRGVAKTPALGLAWTNCIAQRIVMTRLPRGQRKVRVGFSPWVRSGATETERDFWIDEVGMHLGVHRDAEEGLSRGEAERSWIEEGVEEGVPDDPDEDYAVGVSQANGDIDS